MLELVENPTEDEERRKVNGYYVLLPALSRVDYVSGNEVSVTALQYLAQV
jgi:hypothetical protein